MPDVIEPASSGRAGCRGCGGAIAKGELRFGEAIANAFGEGEASVWFHLRCAAFRRPEKLAPSLLASTLEVPDRETLLHVAQAGIAHHRLPRLAQLQRSKSGRAKCRHCGEAISKDLWRVVLEVWEEMRFVPMGFVHLSCARAYFDVDDVLTRLLAWQPAATEAERASIEAAVGPPSAARG